MRGCGQMKNRKREGDEQEQERAGRRGEEKEKEGQNVTVRDMKYRS